MMFRMTLAGAALALSAIPAMADPAKEAFVLSNGQQVLNALNDASLAADDRTEKFGEYMETLADLESVANFVIGKYSRRFSPDDLRRYHEAFRRYALAVYEVQLDRYRGETIKLIGSTDRSATDSVVETVIRRADGKDMKVLWRVLEREGALQVMDVALDIDGNLLWLAIEQRAQLIDVLDRANGSADAVIAKLDAMTQKLEAQKRADLDVSSPAEQAG